MMQKIVARRQQWKSRHRQLLFIRNPATHDETNAETLAMWRQLLSTHIATHIHSHWL
jgi:hypothetical protein